MMYLFGGCYFALKQAVFAKRVCFKILSAYNSPHSAAIYLFDFRISSVSVVVFVFLLFMFFAEQTVGQFRASGVRARTFRFSRHNDTSILKHKESPRRFPRVSSLWLFSIIIISQTPTLLNSHLLVFTPIFQYYFEFCKSFLMNSENVC